MIIILSCLLSLCDAQWYRISIYDSGVTTWSAVGDTIDDKGNAVHRSTWDRICTNVKHIGENAHGMVNSAAKVLWSPSRFIQGAFQAVEGVGYLFYCPGDIITLNIRNFRCVQGFIDVPIGIAEVLHAIGDFLSGASHTVNEAVNILKNSAKLFLNGVLFIEHVALHAILRSAHLLASIPVRIGLFVLETVVNVPLWALSKALTMSMSPMLIGNGREDL
jgi:hypothetical protein